MTQPHRNAVFATLAFSDVFERWRADKTESAESLIMRFYNEGLTDEIRQDIAGIIDLINSHPSVEQFHEREAREKRREQCFLAQKILEKTVDIDNVAFNRLLEKNTGSLHYLKTRS